jgi:SAM-dependent methyltransferase
MTDGWAESAAAWIADIGDEGDFGRRHVLDAPMIERVEARAYGRALDVGCGEGRFCRMMQARGISTVGVDPTAALIARARTCDPQGDYRIGVAEDLPFEDGHFDLVVSYLSLIDIPDIQTAVAEMVRVLRPGGTLLIANLTSFNTAGMELGRQLGPDGERRFCFDHYLEERAAWVEWRGIRIQNWHRPLSAYMSLLLGHGLILQHFSEPGPTGGDPKRADRYRRAPWFLVMEWKRPQVGAKA